MSERDWMVRGFEGRMRLVNQFGFGRLDKGCEVKRFLECAPGSQHARDFQEIEDPDHVASAGNRDHLDGRKFAAKLNDALKPILVRHQNVHDDQVEGLFPIASERLLAINRLLNLKSGPLQRGVHESSDLILIVNDQHGCHGRTRVSDVGSKNNLNRFPYPIAECKCFVILLHSSPCNRLHRVPRGEGRSFDPGLSDGRHAECSSEQDKIGASEDGYGYGAEGGT